MTLIDYFQHIPDFRRGQGQRYDLASMLAIITLGVMSGYQSYRELATFMKANEPELKELLQLRWRAMPSHVTVRTILQHVPAEELTAAFNQWVQEHQHHQVEEAVAIDGKCLGSTVRHAHEADQTFVQIVSAFAHQRQLILGKTSFQNGKAGEGQAVRTLVEQLGLDGVIVTLDALHCQKNVASD